MSKLPYATARSGANARDEITKILRRFGCESVGFMDDYEKQSVLLAFQYRGQQMRLEASAKGWATMYLKEEPWTSRRHLSRKDYEEKAYNQGLIAVNSVLRDWIKGQITAIECGILSFEAVFMPYLLTENGVPLIEVVKSRNLLCNS